MAEDVRPPNRHLCQRCSCIKLGSCPCEIELRDGDLEVLACKVTLISTILQSPCSNRPKVSSHRLQYESGTVKSLCSSPCATDTHATIHAITLPYRGSSVPQHHVMWKPAQVTPVMTPGSRWSRASRWNVPCVPASTSRKAQSGLAASAAEDLTRRGGVSCPSL